MPKRTYTDVKNLPAGYKIEYHENRGYDSPDRWYTASTKRGRTIRDELGWSDFGTFDAARKACVADAKRRKKKTATTRR